MERKLKTLSKNHSDRDGDWVPEFDDGTDILTVDVPNGMKYSRFALAKDCFLGDCRVTTTPRSGATGNLRFKVKWNYVSFGKANYDLKVYGLEEGDAEQPLVVAFGSQNWEEKAKGAVASGRKVKIVISGPQALLLYPLIWGRSSRELFEKQEEIINNEDDSRQRELKLSRVAGVDDAIAITVVICATILAAVIFIGLGLIIKAALDRGKCVKAKTGATNLLSGGIGEVTLDIHDCARGEREVMDQNTSMIKEDADRILGDVTVNGEDQLTKIEQMLQGIFSEIKDLKKKQLMTD